MIIKSYDQWRADRLRALAAADPEEAELQGEETVTCPDCKGEGVVDCDCDCPRCDGVMDCSRCDGLCEISSNDVDRDEYPDVAFTRADYLDELSAELVALARWIGKPELHFLVEAGMTPYTRRASDFKGTFFCRGELVLRDPETGRYFLYRAEQLQ